MGSAGFGSGSGSPLGSKLGSRLRVWFRSVVLRQRVESEMEEEIRFHLESRAEELERGGLSAREASRTARVEFGGAESHKGGMRASLGLRWLDELVVDLRYGVRLLRKSPGFTAIAAGSLALAIGANTTIFSVANAMLFERLGVPHAQDLRMIYHEDDEKSPFHDVWGEWTATPTGRTRNNAFPYPLYKILKDQNRATQPIFAFKDMGLVNVGIGNNAQAAQAQVVSGNLYGEMQTVPVLGRGILPSDDGAPGTGAIAVLSYGFWQRAFGSSASVIGKTIRVNANPVTIVGVNARGFTGAKSVQTSPELFMPLSFIATLKPAPGPDGLLTSNTLSWLNLMTRRKPGITDPQAQIALDTIFKSAVRATMSPKAGDTIPQLVLRDGSHGAELLILQNSKPLYVLLGLTGCVLLLACANVANLMLARAEGRQRNVSLQLALGATRVRIFRQILTESLLLAILGGLLGTALGYLCRNILPRMQQNVWSQTPVNVPFNWKIYGFTLSITLITGVLFGAGPAWRAMRYNVSAALKEGSGAATRARKSWSVKAIVAFQIALSTLLVSGSALFLRTVINLYHISPGFNASHLDLFQVSPSDARYTGPKSVLLHAEIEQRLSTVAGVESVSVMQTPFIAGWWSNSTFQVEGVEQQHAPNGNTAAYLHDQGNQSPFQNTVGSTFFQTMQIPILIGRGFSSQDTKTSPIVAVVNQKLARKFFGTRDPIGRRFSTSSKKVDGKDVPQWTEIIGVCADTHYDNIRGDMPPIHFENYHQSEGDSAFAMTYAVRSNLKMEALLPSLQRAVQSIDPDLPLIDVRTQQQQIDATMQQERIFASLTAGFGLLALLLAGVGVYGVMAYTVTQRTNEIGIRLALGAARGRVRGMVLGDAAWLAVAGVVAGTGMALALVRLVESLLFGVKAYDAVSLAGAAVLLLAVALLASWVPAMRASRIDPMRAIRHD